MEAFGRLPRGVRCAVCGRTRREAWMSGAKIEAHHVIRKSKLKQVCKTRGLDPSVVVWDVRNRLWLCSHPCHSGETTRLCPIPRSKIPRSSFEFAEELGLGYLLDRLYPAES